MRGDGHCGDDGLQGASTARLSGTGFETSSRPRHGTVCRRNMQLQAVLTHRSIQQEFHVTLVLSQGQVKPDTPALGLRLTTMDTMDPYGSNQPRTSVSANSFGICMLDDVLSRAANVVTATPQRQPHTAGSAALPSLHNATCHLALASATVDSPGTTKMNC